MTATRRTFTTSLTAVALAAGLYAVPAFAQIGRASCRERVSLVV